jgi:hypothetical protein
MRLYGYFTVARSGSCLPASPGVGLPGEPAGSQDKFMEDLGTPAPLARQMAALRPGAAFRIYEFTDLGDKSTFKLVFEHTQSSPDVSRT